MAHKFFIPGIVFFFLLCAPECNAQNKLDSLLKVLAKQKREDTVKLHLLNAVAKEYQNTDASKGLTTADAAIELAGNLGDQNALAQAYLIKGQVYIKQNNYREASNLVLQSFTIFERLGDKKGMANGLNSLGNIRLGSSDYDNALEYYKRAMILNEQLGNKAGIAANLNNSGNVYKAAFKYPQALDMYKKAALFYKEAGENGREANVFTNIGLLYMQLTDYPTALIFFQKALKSYPPTSKDYSSNVALANIGIIYSTLKNYSKGMAYFYQVLDLARKNGIKDTSGILKLIAGNYTALKQFDLAEKFYLEAVKVGEQFSNKRDLIGTLNNIGFFYYSSGKYLEAWKSYQKALAMAQETGDKNGISLLNLSIGELCRDAPDSILVQIGINPADQFDTALKYLNTGKTGAMESGNLAYQRFAWEDLSLAFEKQKDYAKSLDAYKNYIALRDSIANNEKEKKINRLNMQYEFDKQSDSIKLQEQLTDQKLQQQVLLAKQQQQELELGKQQIALGTQQLALTNKEKDLQQLAYLKTQADLQNEQLQKNEKEKLLIIAGKEKKIQLADAKKSQYNNKVRLYALLSFLAVLSLIAIILWRNNSNKQKANALLTQQKQETDQQKEKVEQTLEELRATQTQLIQREKMASLGELTAGIAHEIQNPLNFVNNFSEVNTELLEEMEEEISKGNMEEIKSIALSIRQNLEKINVHGKRADGIVKGMMQHSQSNTAKRELTDINALADEYLRLSYHGLRAKDNSVTVTMKTDFDAGIQKINIVQQDIGRVFLNLFNNAFYSVTEKKKQSVNGYEPTIFLSTKLISSPKDGGAKWIEIRIKDNGMGIPKNTLEKIYQPFFTTKPTGQGTGLGLSLSYDIITKANGGTIKAETQEGEFAEFIIHLPA